MGRADRRQLMSPVSGSSGRASRNADGRSVFDSVRVCRETGQLLAAGPLGNIEGVKSGEGMIGDGVVVFVATKHILAIYADEH